MRQKKQHRPDILPDGRYCPKVAAAYIGKSLAWLCRANALGRGPTRTVIGQSVWYYKEDLDAFIRSHRQESPCHFTNDATVNAASSQIVNTPGGAGSQSDTKKYGGQRARQVSERLRQRSANYASTSPNACQHEEQQVRSA